MTPEDVPQRFQDGSPILGDFWTGQTGWKDDPQRGVSGSRPQA